MIRQIKQSKKKAAVFTKVISKFDSLGDGGSWNPEHFLVCLAGDYFHPLKDLEAGHRFILEEMFMPVASF